MSCGSCEAANCSETICSEADYTYSPNPKVKKCPPFKDYQITPEKPNIGNCTSGCQSRCIPVGVCVPANVDPCEWFKTHSLDKLCLIKKGCDKKCC